MTEVRSSQIKATRFRNQSKFAIERPPGDSVSGSIGIGRELL